MKPKVVNTILKTLLALGIFAQGALYGVKALVLMTVIVTLTLVTVYIDYTSINSKSSADQS